MGPKFLLDLGDDGLWGATLGDVRYNGYGSTAAGVDLLDVCLQLSLAASDAGYACARGGQGLGDCFANSARGTSDERL